MANSTIDILKFLTEKPIIVKMRLTSASVAGQAGPMERNRRQAAG
jgi:hypothetical protein